MSKPYLIFIAFISFPKFLKDGMEFLKSLTCTIINCILPINLTCITAYYGCSTAFVELIHKQCQRYALLLAMLHSLRILFTVLSETLCIYLNALLINDSGHHNSHATSVQLKICFAKNRQQFCIYPIHTHLNCRGKIMVTFELY